MLLSFLVTVILNSAFSKNDWVNGKRIVGDNTYFKSSNKEWFYVLEQYKSAKHKLATKYITVPGDEAAEIIKDGNTSFGCVATYEHSTRGLVFKNALLRTSKCFFDKDVQHILKCSIHDSGKMKCVQKNAGAFELYTVCSDKNMAIFESVVLLKSNKRIYLSCKK